MMKEKAKKILNVIPQIIANVTIVLSAVYILFYILDGYNPMLHFLGEQVFLTRYLDIIIAGLGLLLGIGGRELGGRHGLLGRGILLRCGLLRLWDGLGWLNRLGLLRHDGIRWNRLIALNLICRRRRLLGRRHLHGWRLRRSSLRLGLLKEGGRDLRRGITVGNICCSRVCRTIGDTVDSSGWGGGLRPVR